MLRFENMTVRVSWSLVLAAFAILILGASLLGLFSNQTSREAFGTLNRLNVEQAQALNRAYIDVLRARIEMDRAAELLRTPAFERPGPAIERAEALLGSAEAAFARFRAVPPAASQEAAIEALSQRYQSLVDNNLSLQLMLLQDGDHGGYRSGQSRVTESSQAFMAEADDFFAASAGEGQALAAQFRRLADWLGVSLLATLAAAALLIGLVLWGVTRNVIRPLREVVGHFRRIAEGDLAAPIEARGRNEIGQLFAELATMQASLTETVSHLRRGSEGVHEASRRMAEDNAALAAQTQQQGAAQAQTADHLAHLTRAVAGNVTTADEVGRSAEGATRRAREGEAVITRFADTMETIQSHAEEIAGMVALIESIAFQTNILALNASVEAARAGDQGRGFAVVAKEVRELASRSDHAAKEIRGRIEASRQSVAAGGELSREAVEHTREIILAIERVNALMARIHDASLAQQAGIDEVNGAMAQMQAATRDSARLVERAADGAQRLEGEAEGMQAYARGFHLDADPVTDEAAPDWEALAATQDEATRLPALAQ
ncbi:methyl-accepting chemotaxis protein [Halomonas pacifica]|uniref:methyl-accepting chemotaxis protein n=1 Tax=Bisbaumannia pacifica TaxID=77098 RepID=UPI00235A285D|nr:methyl-accepting chemotaxis protein [Halomonas pacifica]MDC8804138.1 methyl-accepting chemotaxis protein [Halomonas pacifica]